MNENKAKRIDKISPVLEVYRPGEISKENKLLNNKQKNKINLINENINRSIMNSNNIDKIEHVQQINKNFDNDNGINNKTNHLMSMTMDDLFRDLVISKNKNNSENKDTNSKKNNPSFEYYHKITDVLVKVREINKNYVIESPKIVSPPNIVNVCLTNQHEYEMGNYANSHKIDDYQSNNIKAEEIANFKKNLENSMKNKAPKINFKTMTQETLNMLKQKRKRDKPIIKIESQEELLNSNTIENPPMNKIIFNAVKNDSSQTSESQILSRNINEQKPINNPNNVKIENPGQEHNNFTNHLNSNIQNPALAGRKLSLFEKFFMNIKNLNSKFQIIINMNSAKTDFQFIYMKENGENICYDINYQNHIRQIGSLIKKVNDKIEVVYQTSELGGNEKAEIVYREELKKMLNDVQNNAKKKEIICKN